MRSIEKLQSDFEEELNDYILEYPVSKEFNFKVSRMDKKHCIKLVEYIQTLSKLCYVTTYGYDEFNIIRVEIIKSD